MWGLNKQQSNYMQKLWQKSMFQWITVVYLPGRMSRLYHSLLLLIFSILTDFIFYNLLQKTEVLLNYIMRTPNQTFQLMILKKEHDQKLVILNSMYMKFKRTSPLYQKIIPLGILIWVNFWRQKLMGKVIRYFAPTQE